MKSTTLLLLFVSLLASVLLSSCSSLDRSAMAQDAKDFGADAALATATATLITAQSQVASMRRELISEQMNPRSEPLEVAGKLFALTLAEELAFRLQGRVDELKRRVAIERAARASGKAPLNLLLPPSALDLPASK